MLKRYSPFRRASTPKGFSARLACLNHAASVRSEPGSNPSWFETVFRALTTGRAGDRARVLFKASHVLGPTAPSRGTADLCARREKASPSHVSGPSRKCQGPCRRAFRRAREPRARGAWLPTASGGRYRPARAHQRISEKIFEAVSGAFAGPSRAPLGGFSGPVGTPRERLFQRSPGR